MKKYKKLIAIMLTICLLFPILGTTMAMAATFVAASGTFYYDPWCSDYGIKRQYFTIEYQGDEYEGVESGSSYQAVEKQDFFM